MNKIPYGYCKCGCGLKTSIPKATVKSKGWIKGEPIDYINHHNRKGKTHVTTCKGERHPRWKGGFTKMNGYILIKCQEHPRANSRGYVFEHRLIAESIIGKYLTDNVEVHHVNGIRDDNRPENLVICENHSYHRLLHVRQRAFDNCGNPNWRKCFLCQIYDDPKNLILPNSGSPHHRSCKNEYEMNRKKRAKF